MVRPHEVADYRNVLRDVAAGAEEPIVIAHCWTVGAESLSFAEAQRLGLFSLLTLVKAAASLRPSPRLMVTVAGSGLHGPLTADPLHPEKATLCGAARVIAQEHESIRIRTLDIGRFDAEAAVAIARECLAPPGDATVAIRERTRWAREYKRVRCGDGDGDTSILRSGGVYLLTGGFGNVALTLAETLATRRKAKLALVSRMVLPDRAEWDRHAGAPRTDVVASRIAAVRALEGLGATVLPLAADAADPAAMTRAVERTIETFGALHGVIHAAGATDAAAFQPAVRTDERSAEEHFRAKVHGTKVLAQVLAGRPLDFCMLTSSLSTVLGGLNFTAYAAANAYLDAFAESVNRSGAATPWMAVDWDGWRFDDTDPRRGDFFMTPREGADAFRRILSRPLRGRVVVSTGPLEDRIRRWIDLEASPSAAAETEVPSVHERPEIDAAFVTPRTAAEHMIADVWGAVLGVASVGIHDNFFHLGGHSLLAIQLISRLRELFQTEIALTALFERPTVAELAAHIDQITGDANKRVEQLEEMLDYIERLSPDEVQALLDAPPPD